MIYWDNNATTPLAPEVLEAMLPFLKEQYFNPSAAYRAAKRVRLAIELAREQVADLIGAHEDEIIFTSCGTEASNTALAPFSSTLICATEHPATRRSARGAKECAVYDNGLIDEGVWAALAPHCEAASFAWANHETGVIQNATTLAQIAHEAGASVHIDLVQAAGKLPINMQENVASYASLSAHKLHGPKGIGALYVRQGMPYTPLLRGGSQEDARRAGTENVAGIIGFGKAAQLALAAQDTYTKLAQLRNQFEAGLRELGHSIVIQGETAPRLPHVSNLRIKGCSAESLTLLLEPAGLICSSGSACTSAEPEPSHVLHAMGLSDLEARGSLRFSLNRYTTDGEVQEALQLLHAAISKIQSVQSMHTGPVMVYKP